jgi:4-amino-4-deoxy-L-arabinose transferase-like glycosyltransferase
VVASDRSTLDGKAKIIVEPQPAAKHRPYTIVALLAASAFVLLWAQSSDSWGPTSPRYAEVAREMFASADYISTRLCGCLWFEKPVLIYLMSALGYRLFSA